MNHKTNKLLILMREFYTGKINANHSYFNAIPLQRRNNLQDSYTLAYVNRISSVYMNKYDISRSFTLRHNKIKYREPQISPQN